MTKPKTPPKKKPASPPPPTARVTHAKLANGPATIVAHPTHPIHDALAPPPVRPGAVEGKYGTVTVSGKKLHDGEPVFLFRATDPLAPAAIRDYAMRAQVAGCPDAFVNAAKEHADRMADWQRANPALVKTLPD